MAGDEYLDLIMKHKTPDWLLERAGLKKPSITGREKITYHLKRMSTEQGAEDIEDAKYFRSLANGNQTGTLTIKEAEEVLELFEGYSPVIIDTSGARWVEVD